jgi:hypothetical protein
MKSATPILIAGVVDDAERRALLAASEQLHKCLSAASGVRWPVGLRFVDSIADILNPTVVITSFLPEVARVEEPISLTEARWRPAFSKLMERDDLSAFLCTVFRYVTNTLEPGERTARAQTVERIRLLNLLAAQLSHDTGINVVDIDAVFAHVGARQMQTDYRLAGPMGAEMAAYTMVVTILAVGLDNVVPPDIQERAWKFHVKRQLDGRRLA